MKHLGCFRALIWGPLSVYEAALVIYLVGQHRAYYQKTMHSVRRVVMVTLTESFSMATRAVCILESRWWNCFAKTESGVSDGSITRGGDGYFMSTSSVCRAVSLKTTIV